MVHPSPSSPFPLYPQQTAALAPLYFPGTAYYAVIAANGTTVIDTGLPYDKRRKETHRCTIADTRGTLSLTVPIEKPDFSSHPTWSDVRLSTHGQWWDKHLTALESAYGRTPYFEFYIDRLTQFFDRYTTQRFENVVALNRAINKEICGILGIDEPVYTNVDEITAGNDYRRTEPSAACPPVEYYQVRQSTLGFIGGLSILDLIFNMGPESQKVILDTAKSL